MQTTKKKRTHDEYIKDTFDSIKLRVLKGKRDIIKQAAKEEGLSVNAWINKLIDHELEK